MFHKANLLIKVRQAEGNVWIVWVDDNIGLWRRTEDDAHYAANIWFSDPEIDLAFDDPKACLEAVTRYNAWAELCHPI